MTLDPDRGFGLLGPEDHEKTELILTERSEGSYGAPALHGMLGDRYLKMCPVPYELIRAGVTVGIGFGVGTGVSFAALACSLAAC